MKIQYSAYNILNYVFYSYPPLSSEGNNIRLLCLLPDTDEGVYSLTMGASQLFSITIRHIAYAIRGMMILYLIVIARMEPFANPSLSKKVPVWESAVWPTPTRS